MNRFDANRNTELDVTTRDLEREQEIEAQMADAWKDQQVDREEWRKEYE